MVEYLNLMAAISILRTKMREIQAEGCIWDSPAYDMVLHAHAYLMKQAAIALRGE